MTPEDVKRALIAHFGPLRAAMIFAASKTGPPGYWTHEQTGVLRPVIEAYLSGRVLNDSEVGILRKYLYQWITRGDWMGAPVAELTAAVEKIRTREDVGLWLREARKYEIDPL